ncbi:MAG TPA: hypothetical protein RMG48_22010 [Myxococcales bacterium LLY-WYZ-16_1]|jgi:ElaB/YqjD/DUF883 family membrane-anchored ribosome-binding protein|nr:hypothetical protein [Myxococcales bacterium LLY-WYZ-16_1]
MGAFDDLIKELEQKRDELRVQIHLGSKEAKDEFERLEKRLDTFLNETRQQATQELDQVGKELKSAYDNLRQRLQS